MYSSRQPPDRLPHFFSSNCSRHIHSHRRVACLIYISLYSRRGPPIRRHPYTRRYPDTRRSKSLGATEKLNSNTGTDKAAFLSKAVILIALAHHRLNGGPILCTSSMRDAPKGSAPHTFGPLFSPWISWRSCLGLSLVRIQQTSTRSALIAYATCGRKSVPKTKKMSDVRYSTYGTEYGKYNREQGRSLSTTPPQMKTSSKIKCERRTHDTVRCFAVLRCSTAR